MATGRVPTTANSPLTAKGDLFTYSTAPARLAVGSNGDTIVADSSTSTGLRYQGSTAAGRNFIINGGFDIWQRGTSFNTTNGGNAYNADRWTYYGGNTGTITQSTALLQTGSLYSLRFTSTGANGTATSYQLIETANTVELQGKTVAFSAYVAGTAGKTASLNLWYSTVDNDGLFGSWTQITATTGSSLTTSGSYQRLVYTYAIPSTARSLRVALDCSVLANTEFVSWSNAQLEIGSVATNFSRAGGTIQGELAACQRYFNRFSSASNAYNNFSTGNVRQTGAGANSYFNFFFPVEMRIAPTAVTLANITSCRIQQGATDSTVTAGLFDGATTKNGTIAAQATIATAGTGTLAANNNTGVTVDWSAEL